MDGAVRIALIADGVEDETRVKALLDRAGLAASVVATIRHAALAASLAKERSFDVAVLARSSTNGRSTVDALDALDASRARIGRVVVADEFTEELSAVANRTSARVCLHAHGHVPLKNAVTAIARDLAEREALEHERRERDDVRALVYVSVLDVIFHLGVEGDDFRFLEINPAFTKATGLEREQVVGRLVRDVIPEPSLSLVLSRYREAITERRTVRWIEATEYPTGRKYGEVSVTPLLDADGRCTRLVGTVHDVTEERERGETIRRYADIVRAVQIGLTVWSVPDANAPGAIRLVACNPAAERSSGVEIASRVGASFRDIYPVGDDEVLELVVAVARDGVVRELPTHRFRAVDDPTRVFAVKAFPLPGACVGLAVEDVSEPARARALAAVERQVLERVAGGGSLAETLTTLVVAIESLAPSKVAAIHLVALDGKTLVHGAAPHLSEAFDRAMDGCRVGVGASGTAAATRRPVVVRDIEEDPRCADFRAIAREAGVRACWSTPILAGDGRVLGTFDVYDRSPASPTPAESDVVDRATHVAGIAIQRHELDEQLRALSGRIESAREEERAGIAREIHDQLGQSLTALKMDLAWITRRATSPEGLSREGLLEKVGGITTMVGETIDLVRRISAELRPGVLDDLGLVAALSWQAQDFQNRTHIACSVSSELEAETLPREIATAVFRVFQEALTNVVRHAQASKVDVELDEVDGALELRVTDDGKGIRAEDVLDPRSLGLLGIRERARRLGGVASFAKAEPKGTVVTLRLPMAPPASSRRHLAERRA